MYHSIHVFCRSSCSCPEHIRPEAHDSDPILSRGWHALLTLSARHLLHDHLPAKRLLQCADVGGGQGRFFAARAVDDEERGEAWLGAWCWIGEERTGDGDYAAEDANSVSGCTWTCCCYGRIRRPGPVSCKFDGDGAAVAETEEMDPVFGPPAFVQEMVEGCGEGLEDVGWVWRRDGLAEEGVEGVVLVCWWVGGELVGDSVWREERVD